MASSWRQPSRGFLRLSLALLLGIAGCAGNGVRSVAVYDFGAAVAPQEARPRRLPPLRQLAVQAPSWLASSAMQYRLAYASGQERASYTLARWAAPPAELLQQLLSRQLMGDAGPPGAAGCRVNVALDEMIQVFDAPAASRATLQARAFLAAASTGAVLAARGFRVAPAAGADARSGAAGFAAAARTLADELGVWLAAAMDEPAVSQACGEPGRR